MSNDTQIAAHMKLVKQLRNSGWQEHAQCWQAVEASARQLAEQPGFVMVPELPDEWPPEFITWFQNLPDLKAEQVWPLYQAARASKGTL